MATPPTLLKLFTSKTAAKEKEKKGQQVLNECNEAGTATLVALDGQREKLGNIEKGMTEIDNNMTEAEETLRKLEAGSSNRGKSGLLQFVQDLFQ